MQGKRTFLGVKYFLTVGLTVVRIKNLGISPDPTWNDGMMDYWNNGFLGIYETYILL